jgi:hypothetical protein
MKPQKTQRHPAVIDLLGGAPTTSPDPLDRPAPPRSNTTRVLAGLAVVAILTGGVMVGKYAVGGDQTANTAAVTAQTGETGQSNLVPLAVTETTTAASSDVDDECRADRGDQNSAPGVIAAWNHAYYVQRNAAAARALATPNSSVVGAAALQGFIDSVPVGTNYCLRTKALSEDIYLVDLSELRPEGAQRITQTVTTKKIGGKWYVDVFK